MVRTAFALLAALPVSGAAVGRHAARLAGGLGSTSPRRDRLGTGGDARAQDAARNLVPERAR